MLKKILTLILLFYTYFVFSQGLDFAQGEVIVQAHPKIENIQVWINNYQKFQGRNTKVKVKKCISPAMNLWLVKFDFTKIHEYRFLQILRKDPLIRLAQFNHFIQQRKVPNDPDFMRQWQYINDGSEGGNPDADLDADLAWDITSGGTTANGDTIVVVALDDGVDLNHSDFGNNLWVNHLEIPDNGIDDDNNGYIDDVNGWNILTETGVLTGGSHGTPVMGIMGAKGNNGIGVTGVNWDVKVMMVQTEFQADEASILAGYGYPLEMRKRYNETNGAEGAFIVATNASWGLDGVMPEDAPIWCAMYDSLGAVGILNCGATTNENANVDVVGDLPTTCPSDYMIAVTNINRTGEKELFAGYGKVNIDLGAFGEETYTLANGNRYEGFGGTSGAAPHVTGAIALLYSAPCENFSNLARTNPAEAALLIREYLLNGVKPVESLDTLTVTGGYLNLYNSLSLLMEACGPCPVPLGVDFSEVTDESLTIKWLSSEEEVSASLRYRMTGTEMWTEIEEVKSPFSLSGLAACTNYEFQVKSFCSEESNGYNRTYTFKTDGCCEYPSNIRITDSKVNEISIAWDPLLAARGYEIQFDQPDVADPQIYHTTDPFISFGDLPPCNLYAFRVRTICADSTTGFSPLQQAQTSGCGSCLDVEYCNSEGDGEFEWISGVELNTLFNESGSDSGYGDYTGMSTDLNTLETYEIKVNIAYQSFPFAENIQVWIDFDQDGVFDDEAENVIDLDEDITSELTAKFTIPEEAKPGLTRMRVSMKWREGPNPDKPDPCLNFDFGEVEDYCVNIIQTVAPCLQPDNFHLLDDPIDNIAFLSWGAAVGALNYEYRYRVQGTENWQTGLTEDPSAVLLSGLTRCRTYEVQARSLCDSLKVGVFSEVFLFNTPCDCRPPTELNLLDTALNSLDLSWAPVESADKYEIVFKKFGEDSQGRIVVNTNAVRLTSLEKCSDYSITIRGFCLDTDGENSESFIVATACDIVSVGELPLDIKNLYLYPNPTADWLFLEFKTTQKMNYQLGLYSLNGKLLKRESFSNQSPGRHLIEWNLKGFSNGIYLLKLNSPRGQVSRRMVKINK